MAETDMIRRPGSRGASAGTLRAVALLELLARPAPARVVAADVLLLRLADGGGRRHRAAAGDARGRHRTACCTSGRRNRLRARQRLVLVAEAFARGAVPAHRRELGGDLAGR